MAGLRRDADSPGALAFALGAPPAAWFAALVGAYVVVGGACASGGGAFASNLVFLFTLATAVAGTAVALRARRRLGGGWPGEEAHLLERRRFLATVAALSGSLFSLVILLQWVAALLLGPCEPGPRGPFAPNL